MNQKINAKIAELLGAFIGDGWIESSQKGLYITGDKLEDKDYYALHLAPLFSEVLSKVNPRDFPYWGVYGIACYKKEVIHRCLAMGWEPGTKALTAKIPSQIMASKNPDIHKALLRGIFDTDGSFWCERSRAKTSTSWKQKYHSHPEIQLGSSSLELLKQAKLLLDQLGIESNISLRGKEGVKNNRKVHNSYGLRIRKTPDIQKWFKVVGSSNPRHQTRHNVWKKWGFLPPRTNISQRKEILTGKLNPYTFYD